MKLIDNSLNKIAENKRSHFWLFFLTLICLTSAMMYLYQPLCPGQDFFFHYRRFQALMDGLKDSPFLIYLDYEAIEGYGYFAKAFYCDVILIPFAVIGNLTNIGFGYQSMIFTMTVLCGVFTYKAVYRIYSSSFAASMSALLFTFAIYRMLDIYHRAALGEALSFTFIPLVFWGLYEVVNGNYKKWYILSIGFALLIFTHVISSVLMFLTMLILLVIYYKPLVKEPKRLRYLLLAGVVTLVMISYYLLPMLEQMASDTFYYNGRNIMDKAQDTKLAFHWIIWGMFSGIIHPMQVFVPGTGLLLTIVIFLRLFIYRTDIKLKAADIGVIIGLIYILMTSSVMPWHIFPFSLLNFIQLPWRLYEFSSWFFALAGGYYLSILIKTNRRVFIGSFVVFIAIFLVLANDSKMYEEIRCYNSIEGNKPLPPNGYHMAGLEYLPAKVPSAEFIAERGVTVIPEHLETKISPIERTGKKMKFDVEVSGKEVIELPLIYYKGYAAELNGQPLHVDESDLGLVRLEVLQSGTVSVYYKGTPIQVASWFITVLSILGLCVYIAISESKTQKTQ